MDGKSYIVRIYRDGTAMEAEHAGARSLAGTIEEVATGDRRSFHDIDGLWAVVAGPAGKRPGKGRA